MSEKQKLTVTQIRERAKALKAQRQLNKINQLSSLELRGISSSDQNTFQRPEPTTSRELSLRDIVTKLDGDFEAYIILGKDKYISELIIYKFGQNENILFKDRLNNREIKGIITGNQLVVTQKSVAHRNGSLTINLTAVKNHQIFNIEYLQPLQKFYSDGLFEFIEQELEEDVISESESLSKIDNIPIDQLTIGEKEEMNPFDLVKEQTINEVKEKENQKYQPVNRWTSIYPFQCAIRNTPSLWVRSHADLFYNDLLHAEAEGKNIISYCQDSLQSQYLFKIFPKSAVYVSPIQTMKGYEVKEFSETMDLTMALVAFKRGGETPVSYNFIDVTEQDETEHVRYGLRSLDAIVPEHDYCLVLVGSDAL